MHEPNNKESNNSLQVQSIPNENSNEHENSKFDEDAATTNMKKNQLKNDNNTCCKTFIIKFHAFYESLGFVMDPKPYNLRWLLVISNLPFFIVSIYLYFNNDNNDNNKYLVESILMSWIGIVSSTFHGMQCTKGHENNMTKNLCRVDKISCFGIIIYIIIMHSISMLYLLIGIMISPMLCIYSKYYLYGHSLWHVLACIYLTLIILYYDNSNIFTARWWDCF